MKYLYLVTYITRDARRDVDWTVAESEEEAKGIILKTYENMVGIEFTPYEREEFFELASGFTIETVTVNNKSYLIKPIEL